MFHFTHLINGPGVCPPARPSVCPPSPTSFAEREGRSKGPFLSAAAAAATHILISLPGRAGVFSAFGIDQNPFMS